MRPFPALPAAILIAAVAGCGGSNDSSPPGPAQPAKNASAYNSDLMARTEGEIRSALRDAVAKRGFRIVRTDTDCVADTARRFTCSSRSRVQVTPGAQSCAVFVSEQRGVINASGKGYWKSANKGADGTESCAG